VVSDEIPPAFSDFAPGSRIAGYRLEEQIGRGGMAVVFRAYDARLDRRVALKILAPGLALDNAFRQRFIRESKAAAAVDHPNIIPVFDAGEASGVLFIAMRFVQGGDVRSLLDRTGPLSAARATGIISQVASALDAAHARGLVHRDVKPANMLLDENAVGERHDHVYLSDFGLSKQSLGQTGITSQGQVLGTLDYMAPEQVEGRRVDGRTDLYSLACAAFELLSGAPPFRRDGGLAAVWAQLSEPPPSLTARHPGLPAEINDVLARAMAKSPADRFGRCGEFAAALRGVFGLGPGDSGPAKRPPPPATQLAVLPAAAPSPPAADVAAVGGAAIAGGAAAAEDASPAAAGSAQPAGPGWGAGPVRDAGSGWGVPVGDAAPMPDVPPAGGSAAAQDRPAAGPSQPGSYEAPPYSGRSYEAGQFAGRPHSPEPLREPPTEAAGMRPLRGTRPGLTGPGAPSGPRAYDPRSTGPRPPWWRSRGALAAAAVVVVLAVVAGVFAVAHGGTGGGSDKLGTGHVAALSVPGCTPASATTPRLAGVVSHQVALGGHPFGVAVTPDGRYSFVSLGNSVAVLSDNGGSLTPTQVTTIPAPGAKKSEAITGNGQYLLAAAGSGAYVINVQTAEAGQGGSAVMGRISSPGGIQSVEVSISPDGRFAFITLQDSANMAVFDLEKSMAEGYGRTGFVGMVPLPGSAPVGIAQSRDGNWLYVTSEKPDGRLYLINMHLAETDPGHAVRSSVPAGCGPARVLVSADGKDVWVTDRDGNALVAFSADKLLSNPSHSLIARVSVGQKPIGLAFVKGGAEIMVADSNLNSVPGADSLALISTRSALQGQNRGALLGFVRAGLVPREIVVEPDGKTLLSTDNNSGQLQAIDVGSLR
jgi:DNA-binding beta-propeller fold protein YncE